MTLLNYSIEKKKSSETMKKKIIVWTVLMVVVTGAVSGCIGYMRHDKFSLHDGSVVIELNDEIWKYCLYSIRFYKSGNYSVYFDDKLTHSLSVDYSDEIVYRDSDMTVRITVCKDNINETVKVW